MDIVLLASLLGAVIIGFIVGYFLSIILNKKDVNTLQNIIVSYKANLEGLNKHVEALKQENDSFYIENRNLYKENATLAEREKNSALTRNQLQQEFENISRKIIEDNRNQFSQHSSNSLKSLLDPMHERLNEFKRNVEENHKQDMIDRTLLKHQIENIVKTNNNLNKQAENLTKALKGSNKIQGNWGEMQLESLLNSAGMQENIDFYKQASGLDLKDSESNQRHMPDFVVKMPDNKHIIIDAKVSLLAYENYCSSESDEEKTIYLKKFNDAIRAQVKDLSTKAYHSNYKLSSPEYTIMFLPIESAYILAISQDPTLHKDAWDKGIVLVSTNTLFAILKTISHIIALEKRNKNSEGIATAASNMLAKFYGFTENMLKIGKNIDTAKASYETALSQLSNGKGNLISMSEKIKQLGIMPNKNKKLPEEFNDFSDEIIENENINSNDDSLLGNK